MSKVTLRRLRVVCAFGLVAAAGAARADGDATRGEKKFEECATCHSLMQGQNGVGPSLHSLFGRKAAEIADFRYSAPMKRSGITWTAKTLDEFIADPQKIVVGNRMPYAGLPDADDRADLIVYLEKATK
jgi:cytochrome c